METATAWRIHTTSVAEFLQDEMNKGNCYGDDTVWKFADGSYGVGQPTLEQMDDSRIMDAVEDGQVKDWLND